MGQRLSDTLISFLTLRWYDRWTYLFPVVRLRLRIFWILGLDGVRTKERSFQNQGRILISKKVLFIKFFLLEGSCSFAMVAINNLPTSWFDLRWLTIFVCNWVLLAVRINWYSPHLLSCWVGRKEPLGHKSWSSPSLPVCYTRGIICFLEWMNEARSFTGVNQSWSCEDLIRTTMWSFDHLMESDFFFLASSVLMRHLCIFTPGNTKGFSTFLWWVLKARTRPPNQVRNLNFVRCVLNDAEIVWFPSVSCVEDGECGTRGSEDCFMTVQILWHCTLPKRLFTKLFT